MNYTRPFVRIRSLGRQRRGPSSTYLRALMLFAWSLLAACRGPSVEIIDLSDGTSAGGVLGAGGMLGIDELDLHRASYSGDHRYVLTTGRSEHRFDLTSIWCVDRSSLAKTSVDTASVIGTIADFSGESKILYLSGSKSIWSRSLPNLDLVAGPLDVDGYFWGAHSLRKVRGHESWVLFQWDGACRALSMSPPEWIWRALPDGVAGGGRVSGTALDDRVAAIVTESPMRIVRVDARTGRVLGDVQIPEVSPASGCVLFSGAVWVLDLAISPARLNGYNERGGAIGPGLDLEVGGVVKIYGSESGKHVVVLSQGPARSSEFRLAMHATVVSVENASAGPTVIAELRCRARAMFDDVAIDEARCTALFVGMDGASFEWDYSGGRRN